MRIINCVTDHRRAHCVGGNRFIQPGGCGDGQLGLAQQPLFQLQQGLGVVAKALVMIHAIVYQTAVWQYTSDVMPEWVINQRYELFAISPSQYFTNTLPKLRDSFKAWRIRVNGWRSFREKLYLKALLRGTYRLGLKPSTFILDENGRNVENPSPS